MFAITTDYEPHQGIAVSRLIGLHEGVLVVVIDVADLYAAKVVAQVRVRHPKQTFSIVVSALLLDVVCPEI